mmetsp:Transcript_9561/g.11975  ORF Transcript_9561/g.11975 Transcript_9561/m.11975 type:complete len:628 (+) Transcript_9561:60-1943(+)
MNNMDDPEIALNVDADEQKKAENIVSVGSDTPRATSNIEGDRTNSTLVELGGKDGKNYGSVPKDDIDKNSDNEDIRQKWYQHKYVKYTAYAVLIILVATYSIIAFVIDFKRAAALFAIEMAIIVIVLINLINEYYLKDKCSLSDSITNLFDNKYVRIGVYVVLIIAVIVFTILFTYQDPIRLLSVVGLFCFISGCYLLSWKRKDIIWRPVIWGFALQFVFALLILRTRVGFEVFKFLGDEFQKLVEYTAAGTAFCFGYVAEDTTVAFIDAEGNVESKTLFAVFAFSVIPTVIFFSSVVSLLYYLGVIQIIVKYLSFVMEYTMGTSSSESLNAAGNIFVGMTEAPLLIKPFLKTMTKSELHAVMTGGFATIAGGVFAIYISFGVNSSHLLAASVMSAPAALAISKILYPETEISPTAVKVRKKGDTNDNDDTKLADDSAVINERIDITKLKDTTEASNAIEAVAKGATIAVQLALNIVGMLIAFLAFIAFLDQTFAWFGSLINIELSFTIACGIIFYPLALIMGIPPNDCRTAGELIGLKIFANEFVAYAEFVQLLGTLSKRTEAVLIYALCGFSNFGSIGVILGGLTPLAPSRSKDLSELVLSAMIAGNIACFMTACVASLVYDPNF